ncbi:MAG: methyltransferase domain-containing protein [Candidatus Abyssubacteria bacterium]|nr:methyltransferase domain-containing protein [Candidatus Abyssubacteria bacterium]
MGTPTTLHLGCGNKKAPEALGIDFNSKSQADIIHDLDKSPWPLESNTFERVICEHVLEHLSDLVCAMAEVYRVCKDGASVEIVTPHFSNVNSWDDPTHKHHFTLASFDYFHEDHPLSYGDVHFESVERRLTFSPSFITLPARLIYSLSPRWYEKHFAFMMPARNLELKLRVCKKGRACSQEDGIDRTQE